MSTKTRGQTRHASRSPRPTPQRVGAVRREPPTPQVRDAQTRNASGVSRRQAPVSPGPTRSPAGRQRRTTRYAARRRRRMGFGFKVGAAIAAAVAVLGVIFFLSHTGGSASDQYNCTVGNPGPGQQAPAIQLPSTDGGTFDLSATRGKTVLLYFQEGLGCEPCWTQLKEIDAQMSAFHTLGISQVVTITTDPLDALAQKVADEGVTSPVLSDRSLAVSTMYQTNQYGMMGASRDGHSFIVVGPDGRIMWRADYGGAPRYTMYVPVTKLLTALRQGIGKGTR